MPIAKSNVRPAAQAPATAGPSITDIRDRLGHTKAVAQMAVQALSSERSPVLQSCAIALNVFVVQPLIAIDEALGRVQS